MFVNVGVFIADKHRPRFTYNNYVHTDRIACDACSTLPQGCHFSVTLEDILGITLFPSQNY